MTTFANDPERFDWIRQHLYVPAVCDILDRLGHRQQAMHQRLRPLDPANCTIVGRARTFRWMETDYVVEDDPYGLEIEAMDSLKPGDVAVHSTDHAGTNAPWGELMSTVAKRNGAAGCICDSQIRDCRKIMELKRSGRVLICSSHIMSTLRDLCNRAIWLDHGHVRRQGTAPELLAEYEASAGAPR